MNHSDSPFSLTGKTALITGGGSGLGLGMARAMVEAGARVVLVGRREEVLRQATSELGPQAHYRTHDVTQFDRNQGLIDELEQSLGPIDFLLNNAGNHLKKPAVETTMEDFQRLLDTHLLAAFSLTRSVAPAMMERGAGGILFTASMASFLGVPNVLAYTAAKTAHLGMVRGLAAELSPAGVRVNAIAPGWIQTDMLGAALAGDPERRDKILGRTPMRRFGTSDDIGYAAVYLCSPAAKFVTGTVLTVDGGASIGF